MKNILVCVSGLTPQVITETLCALTVERGIQIDELFVITTEKGRKVILGKEAIGNPANKYFVKLSDKIQEMASIYKFAFPKFSPSNLIVATEENLNQKDIRSDKDNILFPNKLSEVISKLSEDHDTTLHCSVSGGRKTMSVFMGFALSLFGRNQDRLYHVLTTEKNEKDSSFFFPPTLKRIKEIELSEIPFVRLRGFLDKSEKGLIKNRNYSEIVEQTQIQLENANKDFIKIEVSSGNIYYRNRRKTFGHLSPGQLNFYFGLLDKLRRERAVPMFDIVRNDLSKIKNADSTISKINSEIKKAFGTEWILSEEFQLKKVGSMKYDLPPQLIAKNKEKKNKINPGYAKYGILADVNTQIIIDYD
jgi:CRISPR-associated protein (TIGR02584 family)